VTTNSVSLAWSASAGASGYIIYREGVSTATTPDTNFVDSTCQPDTAYSYAVAATNLAGASSPSAPIQVRTLFVPVGSNNIRVVNPAAAATNAGPSYLFSGHAGLGLTNGLVWSNAASGRTGLVPFTGATNSSGWSWSASIELAGGVNAVTFSASYPTNLAPQTIGQDSPANYSAWPDNSSGGTGFGEWLIAGSSGAGGFLADVSEVLTIATDAAADYGTLWTNDASAGYGLGGWSLTGAGDHAFLFGDPAAVGIGGLGGKVFQLRGRGTNGSNYASAERSLNQPLSAGQTLAFHWGINWDCDTTNGNKGFVILSGTNEIVNVDNGSTEKITFNGADTGFGYGTNAMRWIFKMLSANSLEASSMDRDGEGTFKTNIVVSGAPTAVRFYAANMEPDPRREPYFDELRVEGSYDNLTLGNADKGFGLYAEGGQSVSARRALPDALKAGDSFSVYLDNNWIDEKGEVGLAVRDASGVDRMRFYFVGGDFSYRIDDAVAGRDTKIGYTSGGLPVTFVLDSANAYTLRVGAGSLTGVLADGGAITEFSVFNKGAGPGTARNFYVGEMTAAAQPTTNALVSVEAPLISLATNGSIPAAWWQAYGIPENERNSGDDRDGDGFTNGQEYALGTDPTDRLSSFRITSITRQGSTNTVTWSAVGSKTYQMEGSADLSPLSWSNVGVPVTTEAGATNASGVHATDFDSFFYRLKLVP
jgi:chitodextrinase